MALLAPWGNGLFRLHNTFLRCTDVSKLGAPIRITSPLNNGINPDSLGVCLGFAWGVMSQCLGTYDLRYLFGDLILFCLGINFSSGVLGDVDLGTSFAWGFAWVDLLGSVRQGCNEGGEDIFFEK